MRRVILLVVALMVFNALAGLPAGWTDDFDAAKSEASAECKNILMVFSGSDWCGWCKRFDAETLSRPEFVKAASRKFVLVMIDSPRDKSILSEKARMQNPKLVSMYRIRGYPHVVLTDAKGNELARSAGYVQGGPTSFLIKLDAMVAENSEAIGAKVPEPPKPVDDSGMTYRHVACWTVCTEDPELAAKVDETVEFLMEILKVFDEETSYYYRTMTSYYDGIMLHRDLKSRGKRERFVKAKCYLNLYAPDSLRNWSWCTMFCGNFLSRCKKEPLPDKEREAMLLYVSALVAKRMGIEGGDRQLERFAGERSGMGRVLWELCSSNNAAIGRYYAAKVSLYETGRFGPFISLADMAEVLSGVTGRDAFEVFREYHKLLRKTDVAIRLRGFADEPFEPVKEKPVTPAEAKTDRRVDGADA